MTKRTLEHFLQSGKKVGILGGGQLGMMLCQAAANWRLPIWILDQSKDFPSGKVCDHFIEGNFKNYDDVVAFGRQVDVLTIEIEHVNTEALHQLASEGVEIHPNPKSLDIIKDKGLQKQFYIDHNLPTSRFELIDGKADLLAKSDQFDFPFVIKYRTAGYDGKGVAVIKSQSDIEALEDVPMLWEEMVDIDKEISVIAAKNPSGEIATFPAVEMEFHPTANLVEFLKCPTEITNGEASKADQIARDVISAMDINGLLAVEMFLTNGGEILINEVAPRPHNSGHQTIEGNVTSQYEQHIRGILDLPMGDTRSINPSVMINLLGADGHTGPTRYEGMDQCIDVEGAYIHLYGKTTTKPFRKMGHVTVVDRDLGAAIQRATFIKENLIVKT